MPSPGVAALAGLLLFALLSLARSRIRRSLPGSTLKRRPAWRMGDVVCVLVATAVALVLRLMFLESRPVDNDEPVGLGLVSIAGWALETDARLHPPLSALLMTWVGGAHELGNARGVSVLAGVACVPLVFALVRAAAGRGPATIAALWLASMPAALHTSQLARGYSLAALGVLAAHLCLSKALDTGRERWFFGYSLVAAATLFTEYLTLGPLVGSVAVALWSARERRGLVVGIVGAFGAAVTAVAFTFPFALPTLWLGVGGGPHAPTGSLRALVDGLALFSGPAAPFNGLLVIALVIGAARRRALGGSEVRAIAAIALGVLTLLAFSLFTAVRARYLLPVVPLFVAVGVLGASAFGRIGLTLVAAVACAHAGLLPAYFSGSTTGPELSTGRRTPITVGWLRADPSAAVAVFPEWSLAEASYRLARVFPGRDAGLDCPATLCVRGARNLYGARAENLPGLIEREGRLYVWLRADMELDLPECGVVLREAGTTLLSCKASARAR